MSVLAEKQAAIAALCQVFHVVRLDAFGAVLRDDFDPAKDDATFAIECDDATPRAQYERFFGLLQGLEILLGSRIDLIDYKALDEGTLIRQLPEERISVYKAKKASGR